jgi:intracellular multiplication protein IcmB
LLLSWLPIDIDKSYDGITDIIGLIVNEIYKWVFDDGNPSVYVIGIEDIIDSILVEIVFIKDIYTTWWEVANSLLFSRFY